MRATSLRALIFDVDGTLADTEEAHRVAFNLAFERCGLDWVWHPEDYRELLQVTGGKERIARHVDTLPLPDAERLALIARVPEIHAEKTRFYRAFVAEGAVPLRPGVVRLIDEALAHDCRLGIASTTTAANVDALLRASLGERGAGLFGVVACGDEVALKKPAPDIYRLAMRRLGVEPDAAVAFEDSVPGLRAALAAGLPTIVTPTFWSADGDFNGALRLLPHLGDPHQPIAGEPGRQLAAAPWLTFDELENLWTMGARDADRR